VDTRACAERRRALETGERLQRVIVRRRCNYEALWLLLPGVPFQTLACRLLSFPRREPSLPPTPPPACQDHHRPWPCFVLNSRLCTMPAVAYSHLAEMSDASCTTRRCDWPSVDPRSSRFGARRSEASRHSPPTREGQRFGTCTSSPRT
jgi:hypothetical protein